MIEDRTLDQIARAVVKAGGDESDVLHLAETYEHMQGQLAECNRLDAFGRAAEAGRIFAQLERDYARPLDELARDHLRRGGER